jgi:hypothetical protein
MRGDRLQKTYTMQTTGDPITFVFSEGLLVDQIIEAGARAIAAEVVTKEPYLYKPIRKALKMQFVKVGV